MLRMQIGLDDKGLKLIKSHKFAFYSVFNFRMASTSLVDFQPDFSVQATELENAAFQFF